VGGTHRRGVLRRVCAVRGRPRHRRRADALHLKGQDPGLDQGRSAKECRRAPEGVGSYAEYTSRQAPHPQQVVNAAIGENWSVVDGTVAGKSIRCTARMGGESRQPIWDPAGSLLHEPGLARCRARGGAAARRRGNGGDHAPWKRAHRRTPSETGLSPCERDRLRECSTRTAGRTEGQG